MATITVRPDLSPRVVIVDAPATQITVQEVVDLCRDWEDSMEGMSFPRLIDAAGKEDLGGGVTVGITATLQNAQIWFEARNTVHSMSTATSADPTGQTLIDTGGTFLSDGSTVGDTLFNATTGAMSTVVEVVSDTQLKTLPLVGGSRQDWQIGDTYSVYDYVQCNISGGNLVAVDDVGAPLDPVLTSPNTQVIRTASSSATLQDTSNATLMQYIMEIWQDMGLDPDNNVSYSDDGTTTTKTYGSITVSITDTSIVRTP